MANLVHVTLVVVALGVPADATAPQRPGFNSPQDATRAMLRSARDKDWKEIFRTFTPQARTTLTVHLIIMSQFLVGEGRDKSFNQLLSRHGFEMEKAKRAERQYLDSLKESKIKPDPQKVLRTWADLVKDKSAFFADALAWYDEKYTPEKPAEPVNLAGFKLYDLRMMPDAATAKLTSGSRDIPFNLLFHKVDGRWYLHLDPDEPDDMFLFKLLTDLHQWKL